MRMKDMISPERLEKGLFWGQGLNLVQGCTKVSGACAHCWAESMAAMQQNNPAVKHRIEGTMEGNRFNGSVKMMWDDIDKPLRRKKPTVYIIWNDLFHEAVSQNFQLHTLLMIAECKQHVFIVITKRPEIAKRFNASICYNNKSFPPNMILMVTAENQEAADQRIPILLDTPAAVRGVICEPLLGKVILREEWLPCTNCIDGTLRSFQYTWECPDCKRNNSSPVDGAALKWVIAGGESGKNRRECKPEWATALRFQVRCSDVPFFWKQWDGTNKTGRLLDGITWEQFPEMPHKLSGYHGKNLQYLLDDVELS